MSFRDDRQGRYMGDRPYSRGMWGPGQGDYPRRDDGYRRDRRDHRPPYRPRVGRFDSYDDRDGIYRDRYEDDRDRGRYERDDRKMDIDRHDSQRDMDSRMTDNEMLEEAMVIVEEQRKLSSPNEIFDAPYEIIGSHWD